jgi:triacylglycerol esterase/lipase EstA (alpha/beta hydrolase family)
VVTAITVAALYIGGVAAYIGWALHAIARGASSTWFLAGAVLIYIAVLAVAVAPSFALAWLCRAPRPPGRRIGPAATVRMFWNEMRAIARSGPRMAFSWWRMRDPDAAPAVAPVLLLHGVLCNAGVWRGLQTRFAERGIGPVYTLSYGPPWASIDMFAGDAATKIDAILAATGAGKVTLVGHSMGGLVARAYLRRCGGAKVRCLVTVGTPHHGSVHAWLAPGACLAQLRPGNPWLAELNRDEAVPAPVRGVALWSWHDSMVAPQTSARLAGAKNIELTGIGHNALLASTEVFALVAAELERAAREAGTEADDTHATRIAAA